MGAQIGAVGVLTFTVGLSLARPTIGHVRVGPATAAMFGALLTVGGGLLTPSDALDVLAFLTMPVLTIVSLMIITIVASRAGFFRILAWKLAHGARGDSRRLFRRLFFAGTITGTLFTNDAAVLLFTPMVYDLIQQIRDSSWTRENEIPFYFAVLYVANLVGALVISNPINIIVADWFDIGFVEYALWMAAPAAASMLATYVGLVIVFRRSIPARFSPPVPDDPPQEGRAFRTVSLAVLLATLLGLFAEPWLGFPPGWVAATGAALLLVSYRLLADGSPATVVPEVAWDAVAFVVGMFLVANGLRAVGLTDLIGDGLAGASQLGVHVGHFVAGGVAALSSAVINNHPTAGIMALAIGDLPVEEATREVMALAALIGGDLGPKMLPIGSLAALIWFRMLRQRGVEVSYRRYIAVGVPVTLAAAALSLAVLTLEYRLVH